MPSCYNRCGRLALGSSAYCCECGQANRQALAGRRTGRFSGIDGLEPKGTRLCQCPVCFELFSGERPFVLHRIEGNRVSAAPGKYWLTDCRNPASKGLVPDARGVWSSPQDCARKERLAAHRRQNAVSPIAEAGQLVTGLRSGVLLASRTNRVRKGSNYMAVQGVGLTADLFLRASQDANGHTISSPQESLPPEVTHVSPIDSATHGLPASLPTNPLDANAAQPSGATGTQSR